MSMHGGVPGASAESATTTSATVEPAFPDRIRASLGREWQRILDVSVPHIFARWIVCALLLIFVFLRVIMSGGYYIVAYAYGIFLLHLFIGFLSPREDPEAEQGLVLPTRDTDEFKPFIRRLPEFKFWYSTFKASAISMICTFIPLFDIPVFWPILLIYFIVLVFLTMKRQVKHMLKYKYVPFSIGKKTYSKRGNSERRAD